MMGWGNGINNSGREIGYNVEATCDFPGCNKKIHRGTEYACGGFHDAGKYCCDRYFCYDHQSLVITPEGRPMSVCDECEERLILDDDLNIVGEKTERIE